MREIREEIYIIRKQKSWKQLQFDCRTLVRELPEEESSIYEILKLGLKHLKIEKAIERYKNGDVSLAKVAELAGISIRGMISIAYAHGLEPKYDESLVHSKINPEMAINL